MTFQFSTIFFFIIVGLSVPLLMLSIGRILRPAVPTSEKLTVYECGEVPVHQAWFNFNPRFYIVALVFLIFDVEAAFTYPVVTVFRRWIACGRGAVAFVEIGAFVAILALGLAYVWRRGDLEWLRESISQRDASVHGDVSAGTSQKFAA
jgi:NADH-quinone oxidoreductase subunit A